MNKRKVPDDRFVPAFHGIFVPRDVTLLVLLQLVYILSGLELNARSQLHA